MTKRRDPRQPAFEEQQMLKLVAAFGEEQAALIEWRARATEQARSDLVVNNELATDIVRVLGSRKADADHCWLLREREAIKTSWLRVTEAQATTTGMSRVLFRDNRLGSPRLSTYLYATQYLFLCESQLTLALDLILYFADALSCLDDRFRSWADYRAHKIRKSTMHKKLSSLDELGISFFSLSFDKDLRNQLAHCHFRVRDEVLLVGRIDDAEHEREYSREDLMFCCDQITDVMAVAFMVEKAVLDRAFLQVRNSDHS
jgi:hypothetical protein